MVQRSVTHPSPLSPAPTRVRRWNARSTHHPETSTASAQDSTVSLAWGSGFGFLVVVVGFVFIMSVAWGLLFKE